MKIYVHKKTQLLEFTNKKKLHKPHNLSKKCAFFNKMCIFFTIYMLTLKKNE